MKKYEVSMETPSTFNDTSGATRKTEVEKLVKEFGSYTTLHGLHFLFESSSVVRRILWVMLIGACMVILAFQVRHSYIKLRRYDSLITKDIERSNSLLFPAVTICNQNMFLKSKILGTDVQIYLDEIDDLKAGYQASIMTPLKNASRGISSSFNILKVAEEAGHNLTVMMILCTWRGRKCGPENFTSFVSERVSISYF